MYTPHTESAFESDEGGSVTMEVFRILLAVLFPPLGTFLRVGFGIHFWLNLLLTFLGYIPGLVHAIWIIAQTSEHRLKIEQSRY
jgi:uncharacterized membrane protein YqaE (UPF0057 family)